MKVKWSKFLRIKYLDWILIRFFFEFLTEEYRTNELSELIEIFENFES